MKDSKTKTVMTKVDKDILNQYKKLYPEDKMKYITKEVLENYFKNKIEEKNKTGVK